MEQNLNKSIETAMPDELQIFIKKQQKCLATLIKKSMLATWKNVDLVEVAAGEYLFILENLIFMCTLYKLVLFNLSLMILKYKREKNSKSHI